MKSTQLFPILFFTAIFLFFLIPPTDPDLGWQLKCGEGIVRLHKLCTPDRFSFTMPGFHWVYNGWGYQIITYITYISTGLLGLTILNGLLMVISFTFLARAMKAFWWEKSAAISMIIIGAWPNLKYGIRAQSMTFLFFAVLLFLISELQSKKKYPLYAIPLLFLMWTNLHGAFILGLALLAIESLKIFKNIENAGSHFRKRYLLMVLCSLCASLVSPFGIEAYTEVLSQTPKVMQYIEEYMKPGLYDQFYIAVLVLIYALLVLKTKRLIIADAVKAIVFALSGMLLVRNLQFFYPVFFISVFALLKESNLRTKVAKNMDKSMIVFYPALIFSLLLFQVPNALKSARNWDSLCQDNCPMKAIEFLKRNGIHGNIFTMYGWGGLVDWHLPNSKVYIDGRMIHWSDNKNQMIFYTYLSIRLGFPRWYTLLADTDVIMIENNIPLDKAMQRNPHNWKVIYRDKDTVIYAK